VCFLYLILIFVGPRAALALWWLVDQPRFNAIYDSFFVPFLGFLFLPVTTIMWTIVGAGGVTDWDWFWIGLALLGDLMAYAPGGYSSNRNRVLTMFRPKSAA